MSTSTDLKRELVDPLVPRSIEVLRAGQAPSGAFIASPSFTVYRYAWLRDGAFCAHALDVVGEQDAAEAWHRWVVRSIEAHRPMIASATDRVANGETPPPEAMPPARYTLDGALELLENDDPWPNFQVDGYGMWLWSLEEHLAGQTLPSELTADRRARRRVSRGELASQVLQLLGGVRRRRARIDAWRRLRGARRRPAAAR